MDYRDKHFIKDTIDLDGESFFNCTFTDCILRYSGGALPEMQACTFSDSTFELAGAADRTVIFITAMYHGMGEGGKNLVERTFENIRAGSYLASE